MAFAAPAKQPISRAAASHALMKFGFHKRKDLDLNSISVAKPCRADWNSMTGDERKRHCGECGLNVHNIAGMTAAEVRKLIGTHEGRLCIRLFRRPDGTVITKDCPKGLAAYRRRVARFAGAAFAAAVGLFSASFAQSKTASAHPQNTSVTAVKPVLEGVVVDTAGAVIPGAKVSVRTASKSYSVLSDSIGKYVFAKPDIVGKVKITAEKDGFKDFKGSLEIMAGEPVFYRISLEVGGGEVTVGIFADPAAIDMTSSDNKTTFTIRPDGSWRPY